MLFVIHRANHPELAYRGGQNPIVHLEADLHEVVRWVEANDGHWTFSLSNAGARYTQFRSGLDALNQLDWEAIQATDFRGATVKEHKQAELLVHPRFPFELVERIGVRSVDVHAKAIRMLAKTSYKPVVEVVPVWYY